MLLRIGEFPLARSLNTSSKPRMAHIRLDPETHRRLRIVAAANDSSMQDWLAVVVGDAIEQQWPMVAESSPRT